MLHSIGTIDNIKKGLFYPGFAKYSSDHKPTCAKSISEKDLFLQIKEKNKFMEVDTDIVRYEHTNYFEEKLEFADNRDDTLFYRIKRNMYVRNKFVRKLITRHSEIHIEPSKYVFTPSIRYKVYSPLSKRKSFLKDYKFTVRFSTFIVEENVTFRSSVDDILFYIWNFYKNENYPVDNRLFQYFCLEYYYDRKDILGSGVQAYFNSEADAAQFIFGLFTNFSDVLTVL